MKYVRLEISTAATTKVAVYWHVTACSLAGKYPRFGYSEDEGNRVPQIVNTDPPS
jgi:hypothetical protein